ncbi:PQQ-binding-like beta-propeller repeat protein [Actinospica sp. MGRD01-02]|uniref:PQQ-binding-like beta-propeller repeat protein n=1 Tax=Actinospica acidithermotolerans TaxID=2828514 RepID=A0A941INY0_9ACTN|nr:PQQ-binding-like beta-propeller repeat protein [Actinospica acidithermotolerans]MBR7829916.1 PQQ-binding-like beta-propeller repeat protein [Actinospica acidithermotolerans]
MKRRPRTFRTSAVAGACWLGAAVLAATAACASSGEKSADPAYSGPASGSSSSTAGAAQDGVPGEWITYNGGNGRQGVVTTSPATAAAATSSAAKPAIAWRARLDGAVYGQPLLVGGRILAATENDSVYALDAASGRVLWRTHVGTPQALSALPCGDIDPLGITSTMAYDPATGSLFALAETDGGHHTLYAFDPATGAVRWQHGVEPPSGTPKDNQQRAALTVAFGRVYVPFGGLAGDCGDYIGSVVGTPADGQGTAQVHYSVPTTREGGIWGPGGLLNVGGTLYAAAGNGASMTTFDGSDSVIALSPDLTRTDYFAPSTWAQDNANDQDLGSLSPVSVSGRILALGKHGTAYLLAADRLGGVGGQLTQTQVCPAFGSGAVVGSTVYVACQDGVRALDVTSEGISIVWKSPVAANGSPTVAGTSVWTVRYPAGTLYRLDADTGAVTGQLALGTVPHFASPSLGVGRVYVGTMDGVVAVTG